MRDRLSSGSSRGLLRRARLFQWCVGALLSSRATAPSVPASNIGLVTFEELKTKWTWKSIHNCPGRFILVQEDCVLSPEEMIGSTIELGEFRVEGAKDPVMSR